MKQHPVPQHIASYQFRLVGDMTLKQFAELAGGVIIAYIIFSLSLPAVVKWPFIVLFAFFGFALAFLPIQERPLDIWVTNFIKSIFSPTRYIWQKNNLPPSFLTTQYKKKKKQDKNQVEKKTAFEKYMQTLPSQKKPIVKIDNNEKNRLKNINSLLHKIDFKKETEKQPQQKKPETQNTPRAKAKTQQGKEPALIQKEKPRVRPAPALTPPLSVKSTKKIKQELRPEVVAMFSDQMAMPSKPNTANVVVGMVVDQNNRIIPSCLIEIKNENGETVRALKTNKLGQFYSAAPLKKGNYKIHIEHESYNFDIIKLKVEDKIIPPIKIKATN